jgi:hypothetical protein
VIILVRGTVSTRFVAVTVRVRVKNATVDVTVEDGWVLSTRSERVSNGREGSLHQNSRNNRDRFGVSRGL